MKPIVLWSGAFVVVACSGSTTSSTSPQVSTAQACTDLATEVCNKLEACYPYAVTLTYGSVTTCIARAGINCAASLTATGSTATAADVETCVQGYAATSCNELLGNQEPAACQLHGTLPPGTPCGSDLQCAGSNGYCKASTATCGVCSTRMAGGGACTENEDCQPGLVCSASGTTGSCVTPGAQGAACSATLPCQGPLVCVNGSCGTAPAAGEACSATPDDCDGSQGYYCSAAAICTQVQTAMAGQPCGVSTSGITVCAPGTCQTAPGTTTGTCEAPAADGAACNTDTGPGCLAPAACVSGSCTFENPASCN